MKNLVICLGAVALLAFTSCKQEAPMEQTETPDYASFNEKVAVIKSFYQAHHDENIDAISGLLADTLKWSPPQYTGNQWMGKEDLIGALKDYHAAFDNISFAEGIVMPDSTVNGYWSGSVFPEGTASSSPNNIRVYGTWTAIHTETGKSTGVKFYSIVMVNADGKIAQASDYFDVNGLAVQIAAE
ncbi:nuclear transport factor 2 family protein [uncultured Muriicola sp.]|uniref:nuclear transport factor 2 family protein n=1 Tax=uncultured Muriicola sp. TaxID=1583102 RepID=UPI00261885EF|nr:nuclear transport factor 2 family protein [uncultured Muriicola sp.]